MVETKLGKNANIFVAKEDSESNATQAAATFSPVLGLACALIAWLVTAKKEGGALTVDTTGAKYVNPHVPSVCFVVY